MEHLSLHSSPPTDVDECQLFQPNPQTRICLHDCLNLPGSYRCLCPPGYVLHADRNTCEGKRRDAEHPTYATWLRGRTAPLTPFLPLQMWMSALGASTTAPMVSSASTPSGATAACAPSAPHHATTPAMSRPPACEYHAITSGRRRALHVLYHSIRGQQGDCWQQIVTRSVLGVLQDAPCQRLWDAGGYGSGREHPNTRGLYAGAA